MSNPIDSQVAYSDGANTAMYRTYPPVSANYLRSCFL